MVIFINAETLFGRWTDQRQRLAEGPRGLSFPDLLVGTAAELARKMLLF